MKTTIKALSISALLFASSLNLLAQNTFPSSGHVGIGTTSPHNELDIGSAFSFHDGGHQVMGLGYAPSYGDLNSSQLSAEVRLDPVVGLRLGVSPSVTTTPITYLTINSAGKVGIGTTAPDKKLTVQGSATIGGTANGQVKVRHVDGKDYLLRFQRKPLSPIKKFVKPFALIQVIKSVI